MGVLYTVTEVTAEVSDWLAELGVEISQRGLSRLPLLSEIRDVLDSLEGFDADYNDNGLGSLWQAMITSTGDPDSGGWTLLNITHQKPPSESQEIWFEKGFPELIVKILSRLSSKCGTLVLIPDTGCIPLVITADDDPDHLCAHWPQLKNEDD